MNGIVVFCLTLLIGDLIVFYYLHKKQNSIKEKEIESNLNQRYNYKFNKDHVKDFKNKG